MSEVRWSRQAKNDILDIAEFYDQIDPALANAMVDRIDAASLPLTDHPALGPIVQGRKPLRKWRIRHSPFILLYLIEGADVAVQTVLHAATDW